MAFGLGDIKRPRMMHVLPLLAMALLAAACGGGSDGDKASGTATPTATAQAAAGGLSGDALYKALLSSVFQDSELPSGFSAPRVSDGGLEDDTKAFNPVGSVDIEVTGPSNFNIMSYLVFNSPADAKNHYDNGKTKDLGITGNFPVTGLPAPAKCLTGRDTSGADLAVSVCTVLIGNAEALGASIVEGSAKQGNNEHALALAKAAADHLINVRDNPQARQITRTPTRVPSPTATATRTATAAPPATTTRTATATVAPTRTATVAPTPTRSTGPATAQQLHDALLASEFAVADLPRGFSSPETSAGNAGSGPTTYKVIGQIDIDMGGPDAFNAILFLVYPTDADAKARYDDVATSTGFTMTGEFVPTGFTTPAKCLTTTTQSQGQTLGITYCITIVGNVEIQGISALTTNTTRGNNDNAAALAKSAITHLNKVKQGR